MEELNEQLIRLRIAEQPSFGDRDVRGQAIDFINRASQRGDVVGFVGGGLRESLRNDSFEARPLEQRRLK